MLEMPLLPSIRLLRVVCRHGACVATASNTVPGIDCCLVVRLSVRVGLCLTFGLLLAIALRMTNRCRRPVLATSTSRCLPLIAWPWLLWLRPSQQ
jgi:hypothetical protein